MSSRLIYVMGPSGAGKDSLLAWLNEQIPASCAVHWARRTISRPVQPGGEEHESVDAATFDRLRRDQAFALHWQANGLHYGVKHVELLPLQSGAWVLVNGSRGHVLEAMRHFPGMTVLHVTASPTVLRQRLIARNRETLEMVELRVQRALAFRPPADVATIEIQNDRTLEHAGVQVLEALCRLPGWPEASYQPGNQRPDQAS